MSSYFKTREALADATLSEFENLYKSAFALTEDDALDGPSVRKKDSDTLIATLDDGVDRIKKFLEWSAWSACRSGHTF
ncbi:MAG: hypothetical protein Q7T21_15125 [Gallionella sp.]|nr:hypothetical protein [Gallionella sp.]